MEKQQSGYVSFLLRLWRESSGQGPHPGANATVWCASLQEPLAGERVSFASLEELFAYLRRKTGAMSDAGAEERGSKG
jgi:hypothetical protein